MTIAQFKNKILDWVKTGIPKNIKSYNIRTLLQEISKKLPDVDNYQMNEMYALSKDNDDENNLKSVKIKPLEYQDQELTPEEQEQALKNLGIKTIVIEGNRYFLYKKPGNAEINIQQGDIAVLGWNNASSFILLLEYESGDPELFTSWRTVDSYGYLSTPSWATLNNGQIWNFPSGKRGDAWAIRISNNTEEQGATNADGAIWLGGTSGIIVGHMTLLICMQNSAGGSFSDVGHKYLIINQKKATSVITVSTYSALPINADALIGVIYLVLDTGNTYYFDTEVNDYTQIGSVVKGTLITSAIFEDENHIPVTPDGTKLYLDTTTGLYYRWDGVSFIPLDSQGVDYSNLTQDTLPKMGGEGNLVDSKVKDAPNGVEVDGDVRAKAFIGRATAHSVITSFEIDASDLSEMYQITMTGHTTMSVTNRANGLTVVATAWVKGEFNLNFSNLTFDEDNSLDYDGTLWNLVVMEWSDTASHNIGTWRITSQKTI